MAKACEICGKKVTVGNNVSHSNRKTRRTWLPNLVSMKASIDGAIKRIRVCTGCKRTIAKKIAS